MHSVHNQLDRLPSLTASASVQPFLGVPSAASKLADFAVVRARIQVFTIQSCECDVHLLLTRVWLPPRAPPCAWRADAPTPSFRCAVNASAAVSRTVSGKALLSSGDDASLTQPRPSNCQAKDWKRHKQFCTPQAKK